MNILTFDIEEWYIDERQGWLTPDKRTEYDTQLEKILDVLDEHKYKATFFCVGKMATHFPEVIKKIEKRGHEIGCHSNTHQWLNKMNKDEGRYDTKEAIEALEQCIGKKIVSYRAPAFSIGEYNKWAFEVLAENGILYDSSVYPANRDFGGFPHFGSQEPTIIKHEGISLREYPIPLCHFAGSKFAYSGGGYLRFFPVAFVKKLMMHNDYAMIYLHIADLVPEANGVMSKKEYEAYFKEEGTIYARYKRYFKANFGKKKAWNKLTSLLSSMTFESMQMASQTYDWDKAKVVKI